MANLIIKSSADNLVLQGSDASPAITVGATGTTTFAENATMSGTANNLGTSTAGTLSSGVTFPSGHIIQTITDSDTGTTRSVTGSNYGDVAGLSCQITSVGLNSKFLIGFTSSMAQGTSANEMLMDIKRVITGGATTNEIVNVDYGVAHKRDGDWGSLTGFYVDSPSQSKLTVITYSLRAKSNSTGTVNWMHSNGQSSLMVQEIAT
jgi:hypothetical protein